MNCIHCGEELSVAMDGFCNEDCELEYYRTMEHLNDIRILRGEEDDDRE